MGVFPFGHLRPGFQHSVSVKLSNGLIRAGHLVLNFSDRDVARALSWFGSRKLGQPWYLANAALAAFCEHHLTRFGCCWVTPTSSCRIRSRRYAPPCLGCASHNGTSIRCFEPDNIRRLNNKFGVVDATFVSTSGPAMRALRTGGHKVAFLPNPMDVSIERGKRCDLMADRLEHDLFYACAAIRLIRPG